MIATLARRVVPKRFRPLGYLTHLVRTRTGQQVLKGPFAGMRYVDQSVGSAYIPKLLGLYEQELTGCIQAIERLQPELIVEIGAAEGYYAVGLALRNASSRMIAFEMTAAGQQAIAQMAALNGVAGRVEIRGKCEPADLVGALADVSHPVIVCDTEGYEARLLDPEAVPALRRAAILVEVHEFIIRGITDTLKSRFGDSHTIQHLWQTPRASADFPWRTLGTALLPNFYLDLAVSDLRPERMSWLWMEPSPRSPKLGLAGAIEVGDPLKE